MPLFSIADENMGSNHYMTEKICDVALGMSTPIYSGAKCASMYFSNKINEIPFGCDPKSFCQKVAKIIEQGSDSNEILEARKKDVLYKNNLFSVFSRIVESQ